MRPLSVLIPLLLLASVARADDPFPFFAQEAEVMTAARRVQSPRETPAAVDVITREEIRASGAVDLCDVLRFRPGLDVIDGRNVGGSNRCVVSIRGMARDQVAELLVLIDGRSMYSPVSGVILWEQLPVQLQNIERIEIVRGPNAALYGSGAGLGVINIITRAPVRSRWLSVGARGGSRGMAMAEEAVEASGKSLGARISHTFRQEGGHPTVTGFPSNDFLHSQKANGRLEWRAGDFGLEALAGGSWDTFGEPTDEKAQGRFRTHFESLRAAHSIDEDNTAQATVTRTEQVSVGDPSTDGGPRPTRYHQYDVEALHSFGWWDGRAHTTWGGGLRYSVVDANSLFGDDHIQLNRIVRGFAHQTLRFADDWRFVGGVSLEQPYFAGSRHADYQAALIYDVRPGHALRAGYSMAHTNPGLANTKPNFVAVNNAFVGPVVTLIPNDHLNSYELQNYEAGYRGEYLDKRLVLGSSLYYMKIRDHTNLETISGDAANGVFPQVMQYQNSNYLVARGAELEAKAAFRRGGSAYANYAFETVSDRDGHRLYKDTTPKHIVNFGGIVPLAAGFSASANVGWKGGYLADSITQNQLDIPPFWRLDARLAYAPRAWLELFVAGRNLLTPRHVEFGDGYTVPRTWQGGVTVKFP